MFFLVYFSQGFTLEQALAMAFDEDLVPEGIYVEPPDSNVLTDEESSGEDDECDINHLPGRQLAASAEVVLGNHQRILDASEESETVVQGETEDEKRGVRGSENTKDKDEVASTSKTKRHERAQRSYSWIVADILNNFDRPFPTPDFTRYSDMTPAELLELFFDEDIYSLILNESSSYAAFKNCPDPKITIEELKCAFAILIVSGYNEL